MSTLRTNLTAVVHERDTLAKELIYARTALQCLHDHLSPPHERRGGYPSNADAAFAANDRVTHMEGILRRMGYVLLPNGELETPDGEIIRS